MTRVFRRLRYLVFGKSEAERFAERQAFIEAVPRVLAQNSHDVATLVKDHNVLIERQGGVPEKHEHSMKFNQRVSDA